MPRAQKRPVNSAEAEFYDLAVQAGWVPTKRGWPDFLLSKGNRMICVEVKAKRGYGLKREQVATMRFLAEHGIECFRWTPEDGFVRFTPERELGFHSGREIRKRQPASITAGAPLAKPEHKPEPNPL